MVKKILILLLIFVFKVNAQSIEVFAVTDTTDYLIGDYIKYRIELTYDEGIRVDSIFVRDSVKTLEFIEEKPVQTGNKDDEIFEIHDYIFSKYDSTQVTIPEIPIKYYVGNETEPSVIYTNEVTINVSTLPVDTQKDIQDVKAPLRIQFDWWLILIIALVLLLLAAAAYYFYRKYKKKKSGAEKVVKRIIVSPHKEALKKLYELQDKKLWQQGMIKEYHSEITGIIREYFEKRFGFNALEQTSTEIIDELRKINEAGAILDDVRNFLDNADLVKFAKFEPMPSVNEQMMNQALDIVKKTKLESEDKVVEEKVNVE